MSKHSSRSNGGSSGGGFPVFAAIMLGIVLGLMIAGAIALMIVKKTPVTLAPKEVREAPQPAAGTAARTAPKPATPPENKARFEFYKELTDKPDGSTARKPAPKPAPSLARQHPASAVAAAKPADSSAAKATYLLQAGAFQNADDAEKVKAKLALIGMEANVQSANIPDKGVWYRVRLGPYHGADEMNTALNTLKQNGINAAPIRAQ